VSAIPPAAQVLIKAASCPAKEYTVLSVSIPFSYNLIVFNISPNSYKN